MKIVDEIVAAPAGARFYRADLHVHSFGGSHDVTDSAMSPSGIISAALAEGITVVSVTDHNEVRNVRAAVEASSDSGVLVIPGVELSTPDGHMLVYWESVDLLEDFVGKLSFADRGRPNSRCQSSALDCLNKLDPCRSFAILAHVDDGGGLEQVHSGFSPHKLDIISHPALLGLELRSAQSDISYSDSDPVAERVDFGRKRIAKLKLGEKQFLARVLFSDAHSLGTLGRNAQGNQKITRIKMDSPSFHGLRVALQDADARIRLEDDVPPCVPYLMGMKIEGGFLDGHVIHFSRNLNCIIGGRGAGKSTAFEAARTLSPIPSSNKLVDSEVWPVTLHLVWVDQAGEQHVIRRLISEEPQNLSDPLTGPVQFELESYGQSETAQTSAEAQQDPAVLLEYLDKFTRVSDLLVNEDRIRDQLLANQTELEKAGSQVARIPEVKRLLAHSEQQLKALESANAKEVVLLERKIAEERGIRETMEGRLSVLSGEVANDTVGEIVTELRGLAKPADLKVGAMELESIITQLAAFGDEFGKTQKGLVECARKMVAEIKKDLGAWKAKEKAITDQIETKRKELLAKGIRLDSAYIKKLATDETNHRNLLKNLAEWEKRQKQLQAARAELLKARQQVRAQIWKARLRYSITANAALKNALSDLFVDISFVESGISPEAEEIIRDAMGWRTAQVPRAALIVEQVTVPKLLLAIKKTDPAPLLAVVAAEQSKLFRRDEALAILNTLAQPSALFRLERCRYDDRPKITVTKRMQKAGKTSFLSKDFAKLSLGQQQSVLLALMLSSDSNAPLLIDQPEDNLDSEFIFHSLVPVLRAAKERRQVIVVTHNPNIAVLGDAEQIVALKSTSDQSIMVANGCIDEAKTRAMVCQILEGAEEAFRRRGKMYGVL